MGLDQFFYAASKHLIDDIRSVYNDGHKYVAEFAIHNLFNHKENNFYQRNNWTLDALLRDHCERLTCDDDSVYIVPKDTVKELLKIKRFRDQSKEDYERALYAIRSLASIYNDTLAGETLLYLRSY